MEGREMIRDTSMTTKGKSCLTSLVALHDGLTTSVDKERDVCVTHLGICKSFDMVPHGILISKLDKFEFDG